MILLVGAEKGGTGKTTLAVNLAVLRAGQERDVLLLDADPQRSMSFWASIRDQESPARPMTCLQKTGDLRSTVQSMADKFDDLIIDTGGRDSEELRSALLVADCLLIPVKPSQYDLWSLAKMVNLIEDARAFNRLLKAVVVVNQANPHPMVTETSEAGQYLAGVKQITRLKTVIRDRIAFRKSTRQGLAVIETRPIDSKAADEIMSLHEEVYRDRI